MNTKKEQMWQAYIDGELSATEMASFEESLNVSEQQLLTSDLQFDRALSDRLATNAECPDDVWARTKALLESHVAETEGDTQDEKPIPKNIIHLHRPWYHNLAAIAAVAMITLMVSWLTPSFLGQSSAPVVLAEKTVGELAARSEVDQPTREQIQQYMAKNNYQVTLVAIDTLRIVQMHSNVEFLGAARSQHDGVVELYFECCHKPVKIVLAQRGTAEAREIGRAIGQDNDLQNIRVIGGYVAGVVSKHPAEGLLEIFAGQHM